METSERKRGTGRGGARAGAGRKRTDHGKAYTFYATTETERILESLPSGKREFINEAIAALAARKGLP